MQLTKSQIKAIEELFEQYKKKERRIIDFSAPTGSGKTFMAANFISKIFGFHNGQKNIKTMFIVATISNAELPKAFAKKLEEYKKHLLFKDFTVEFRKSPSNSKKIKHEHVRGFEFENNKVLIFGTSSFGRKKIFTEQGILENFIYELKMKKQNIIYIRDEAHKGGATSRETTETFYKRFDEKIIEIANFTIQMTATPKGYNDLIELKEEDLLNDGVCLLKNESIYNEFQRSTSTSDDLIRASLDKFKKIQKEYKEGNLPYFIRPALLIQVDSKSKKISQNDYDLTIKKIVNIVEKEYKFNYLKYFSNDIEGNAKEDLSLDSASRPNSNYDVIIFKVGPATGWDIPRACMLLQIREVSSESLNIQTIGRIKRNPIKGLEFNDITNKYYIYSNYQEGQRSLASYKLKDIFDKLRLYQGNLFLDNNSKKLIEKEYHRKLIKFFKSSHINYLCKENNFKSSLPLQEREYRNKNATDNSYSIMAYSIFKLKIWNDNEIRYNEKYFTKGLYDIIDNLKNTLSISIEIIKYTILKEFITKIKSIFFDSYNLYRENEIYKLIPEQKLNQNYKMWISSNNSNEFDISYMKKYGYTLIRAINKNLKDIQFLDSYPETVFMKKIIDEIEEEEEYSSKIDFFSKMPTQTSKIFFEYLSSKDNEKHKAFIDFALVSKEKILMVEVKGWNDYDEKKTENLLDAFNKYKKQNSKSNIDLAICYSGKEDGKNKKPMVKISKNKKGLSIRKMLRDFLR